MFEMNEINNQNLNETIYVDGNPFINPSISILQEVYRLEKYDFDKIINGKSFFSEAKNLLYGTCIALFINMIAKFIGSRIDPKIIFENWEVYAFLISIFSLFTAWLIDRFCPSKQKEIINKIKVHFNI